MRRAVRVPLAATVQERLNRRQVTADRKRGKGTLQADDEWRKARKTRVILDVLATLKSMTGKRERCMYCLDSHGTDIEHFWPKTPYPDRMFFWPNLLLCCTECGRLKGNRFPLSGGQPLLIDPTAEDPWLHLDFDPTTGNVVARFDQDSGDWSPKGLKTVEILQLDRREALAAGYSRTLAHLSSLVERHLSGGDPGEAELVASLRSADDHGLLGWCVFGTGQDEPPFRNLREQRPGVWRACMAAVQEP